MNLNLTSLGREARRRAREWLHGRVVWLTDERRDLDGRPSERFAAVLVLGREHYTERRRLYPIRGLGDLNKVLKLEFARAPETLWLAGPLIGEQRQVVIYAPKPGVATRAGLSLWTIPETAALVGLLARDEFASIERDGFAYHLAGSGESQPAGGAVPTAALFAMAVGLSDARVPQAWDAAAVRSRLVAGLKRLPAGAWISGWRPTGQPFASIEWKKLGTLAAVIAVAYLALASGYLSLVRPWREHAQASLGTQVEALIRAQREVEALSAEQSAIGTLIGGRTGTYEVWRLAGLAWQRGARLSAIQVVDGRVTLRGTAPAATDVLAALAGAAGVKEARFTAPVQRGGAGEDFAISLALGAPRG